ncbi:MAG TPA: hypothetical protein VLM79_00845 [Kofleriaceae bacterium]|nr:hypothetical protein [Kofleriaceae bacterium]
MMDAQAVLVPAWSSVTSGGYPRNSVALTPHCGAADDAGAIGARPRCTNALPADPRHIIAYAPDPVPEGSITAKFFHGAVEPGFHVYELKCIGPARRAEIAACLARYHFPATIPQMADIVEECGSLDPNYPMIRPAPDGLDTELTVELMDDIQSWQPDPSECL